MSWLVDTNVISELRKRERGHPGVVRWAAAIDPIDIHTSVLVIGEIRRGVELKRRVDEAQASALDLWLERVRRELGPRVLPVDDLVVEVWGRLGIPDALPAIDGLIAATALVHGLTVVSRNVVDLQRAGVALLNPFDG